LKYWRRCLRRGDRISLLAFSREAGRAYWWWGAPHLANAASAHRARLSRLRTDCPGVL